jgi:hypothetical protein
MAATLSRPPASPTKGLKTAVFALNLLSPPFFSHCRTHCKPLHLLANERCPPHLTCSTAFTASSSLPLLPFPAAVWPPPGTITCCAQGIKVSNLPEQQNHLLPQVPHLICSRLYRCQESLSFIHCSFLSLTCALCCCCVTSQRHTVATAKRFTCSRGCQQQRPLALVALKNEIKNILSNGCCAVAKCNVLMHELTCGFNERTWKRGNF